MTGYSLIFWLFYVFSVFFFVSASIIPRLTKLSTKSGLGSVSQIARAYVLKEARFVTGIAPAPRRIENS